MSATNGSRIFLIGHGAVLDDGTQINMPYPIHFYVREGILYDRSLIPGFFQTFAPPIPGFTFQALCEKADISNEHLRIPASGNMKEHLFYAVGDNLQVCPRFRIKPSVALPDSIVSNVANISGDYDLRTSFPFLQSAPPTQREIVKIGNGSLLRFTFTTGSPFKNDIVLIPLKTMGQPITAVRLSEIAAWANTEYNKDKRYELEFHWLACRATVKGDKPSDLALDSDE